MRSKLLFVIILALVVGLTTIGGSAINGVWSSPPAALQTESVTATEYVAQGKQALYDHNILLAKEKFLAAVAADPADQEAQLFLGVTRLAAIYEDGQQVNTPALDNIKEIAEQFGITFSNFNVYNTQATSTDKLPDTAPSTGKVFEFVGKKVLPEVDAALKNLEKVTAANFSATLQPPALAKSGNPYIIDYADVLTIRTLVYAARAALNLLLAYDMNVHIPSIISADPKDLQDIRKLIVEHPAFATAKEPAQLTAARTALHNFVTNYNLASDAIALRSGQTGHLFVLDAPLTNELAAVQAVKLAQIKAALADIDASLNGPHLYSFAKADDHNRTVDLSKLFNAAAPVNIRSKIINLDKNDIIPDLTFGGILPLGVVSPSLSDGAAAAEWELAWKKTNDQYNLHDVAYNGSIYVAVGTEFGTQGYPQGYVVTSPDGITWTKQSSMANSYFSRVKWAGDRFWIIGDGSGKGLLSSSTDGVNWTSQTGSSYYYFSDIAWGNNKFVQVGSLTETSPDGVNWTIQTVGSGIYITSIVWAGNQFVTSGFEWLSPGQNKLVIRTSADGVNWTKQNIVSEPILNGMTSRLTWSGSMFVAFWTGFNNGFDPETVIFTSPDGSNWTKRTTVGATAVGDIAFGGGEFMAVGSGGMVVSSDGINWSQRNFLTENNFSAVTYGKNRFLVVGENGVHVNTGLPPASGTSTAYTVTATVSGPGGMITPASSKVKSGASTTFVVKPDYGYETGSVYGCGGKLNSGRYVTGPITEACTVTASFNALPLNLTITSKPLNPLSSGAKSGVINFTVTGAATQEELAAAVSSSDPWLTAGALTYNKGKGSLKYSVSANESSKSRQGSIAIADKNYPIGQLGMSCKLTLSNPGILPKSGASVTAAVTIFPADGSWSVSGVKWSPATLTDWLQGFTVGAVQTGSSSLTLTAGANTSGKRRSAVLTFQSSDGKSKKSLTVSQGN